MEVKNFTPFQAGRLIYLDRDAAERLVVVLKATFRIIPGKGLTEPAEEQEPIVPADEFFGDPAASSIRQEGELGPAKPATDVFLRGSAVAPRGRARVVDVFFRVGPTSRGARVFGDRVFGRILGRIAPTEPAPFESIPLVFERAFGGRDGEPKGTEQTEWERRNPVGVGFRGARCKKPLEGSALPNIEDPACLLDEPGKRVAPVGFMPVGRSWEPRVKYAGTYDERWMATRMPLLPEDFDPRFYNAAPAGLVAPGYLEGGEPVEVSGCTRDGRLAFALPRPRPGAVVRTCDRVEELVLDLETVTVDTERLLVFLVWKKEMRVHEEVGKLREIVFRLEEEG